MKFTEGFALTVLIGCLLNSGINGDEEDDQEPKPNCVDGTYCYLIQGDIARQSVKYGKDAAQYYKKADEQFVKYKESIHSEDEALKKACEETHNKCSEEAAQMAVEGLDYPAAYQKPCSYRTYSRDVFGCQNIKEWPENLRTSIPDNHKACNIVCDMDETKEYALSNGQKIFLSSDEPDMSSVSSAVPEARLGEGIRAITHQYPSVTDKNDGWKEFKYCGNDQWVGKGFNIPSETPAYGVSFFCGVINQTGREYTALHDGASGRYAKQKGGKQVLALDGHSVIPYLVKTKDPNRCPADSFVVGIEVTLQEVTTYGKVVRQVNMICSKGNFSAIPTAAPGNPEVRICPAGSAMCAVKIKVQNFKNVEFMVDVGIGCCGGDDTKCPTCFSTVKVDNKAPLPDIFDFQRTNDYLFWDQVFGTHISRYNRFYTPFTIADEKQWKQSKCSTGTFVSEVEIRNPRSGYHLQRRIRQMIFTCRAPDGSRKNTLDMYDRLTSGGYTLGEHEPSRTKTAKCDEGAVAQSIKLEYYLDRERSDSEQSLVNAWGVGLNCIGEFSGDYQGAYFQAVSSADLKDYDMVMVAADCVVDGIDSDIAVCGFEHKLEHSRKGTYEGLFLRVLCCAKV